MVVAGVVGGRECEGLQFYPKLNTLCGEHFPTTVNLMKMGVEVRLSHSMCDKGTETMIDSLFGCVRARRI